MLYELFTGNFCTMLRIKDGIGKNSAVDILNQ